MNLYLLATIVVAFALQLNPYLIGLLATAALLEMAYNDGVLAKIFEFAKAHLLPDSLFQSSEKSRTKQNSFWDDDEDEDF